MKDYLKKENPSWQIPDRRLRKFLKTQTLQSESAVVDEAKKPRFGLGLKMFSTKMKTEAPAEAPPSQVTSPPEEVDDAPSPIKEEAPRVATPKAAVDAEATAEVKEVTVTHTDDNDGEQEKPCFACASCVVM